MIQNKALIVFLVLVLVGGGAYYLGTQRNQYSEPWPPSSEYKPNPKPTPKPEDGVPNSFKSACSSDSFYKSNNKYYHTTSVYDEGDVDPTAIIKEISKEEYVQEYQHSKLGDGGCMRPLKPVVYLYPKTIQKVNVQLDYNGTIFADYPDYDPVQKGWTVTAFPDGKIINKDGKEYSYIFWEGTPAAPIEYDLSTGFVVRGQDTKVFLQNTLAQMGLTPKEYNEFIVYWYPLMKDNAYNLIHFAEKQYTDQAPLTITPTPDAILRVFMVFKPLQEKISIKPQTIKSFVRKGFTVIEWGGTEIKN